MCNAANAILDAGKAIGRGKTGRGCFMKARIRVPPAALPRYHARAPVVWWPRRQHKRRVHAASLLTTAALCFFVSAAGTALKPQTRETDPDCRDRDSSGRRLWVNR
jgi:hypothetical protein